jgi:hypothetical protein
MLAACIRLVVLFHVATSSVVVVDSIEAFSDAIAAQAPGTDAFYSFESLKANCSNISRCYTKMPIIIDQQKGVSLAPQGDGQLVFQTSLCANMGNSRGLFHVFDNATLQLTRVTWGSCGGGRNGQFANIFACNATVLLNDTIISDAGNYEGSGGGLFGSNIKLRAYNTSWLDNQAKHGGAIATVSSDVGIYDSNFAGNYAGTGAEGSGGAVSFRGVGAPDFCVYYGPGNFSANHGDRRNVTMVRNTVFAGNANLGVVGGGGGAAYLDVATNQDGAPVFDGCTFTNNSCTGIYIAPWGFSMGGAVSVGSLGCAVDKGQWFKWENCTCGGNMPWDFADSVSECGLQPGDPNNTWPVGFVCKTPLADWVPGNNDTSRAGPCAYWCNEQ